jgi:hypothetical protein
VALTRCTDFGRSPGRWRLGSGALVPRCPSPLDRRHSAQGDPATPLGIQHRDREGDGVRPRALSRDVAPGHALAAADGLRVVESSSTRPEAACATRERT